MLNAETKVCCLIGDPVAHSLSPLVHNRGYQALGLNYVYLAFRTKEAGPAITAMRALGITGMSITIPHKTSALEHVDEVDTRAREIGSINTIVNRNGHLKGYNTDYDAALKALSEKTPLRGKKAVLLGAGATALTIALALKHKGSHLVILNRTPGKAADLAARVGAESSGGFDRLREIAGADILINATPVGMWPAVDELPVPAAYLHPGLVVFDVIYRPRETRLLSEAKKAGGKVVYGHKMFFYQAIRQFELFTGQAAPAVQMGQALAKVLKGESRAV
ncbi:MAG: shikimate dehydrogenase [Chloroflexota bacterium]